MNSFLPAVSILFAVFATAVPWGLPVDATFILPLVVVMMIFCWRTVPEAVLTPGAALLLGLLTDAMTGGPLGFWGLLALIAAIVGGRARVLDDGRSLAPIWLAWAGLAAFLGLAGWLLASLFYARWLSAWPIGFGVLASILLFPVVLRGVAWVMHGSHARTMIHRGRL
jgi:rod shape-determining protein MreD